MAPEFGGTGGAFSSTDLLAAALGSCIATNLGPVAERHGIPLAAFELVVRKEMGQQPRRVSRLAVEVRCNVAVPVELRRRLEQAAASCSVQRSLSPELLHDITFVFPDASS